LNILNIFFSMLKYVIFLPLKIQFRKKILLKLMKNLQKIIINLRKLRVWTNNKSFRLIKKFEILSCRENFSFTFYLVGLLFIKKYSKISQMIRNRVSQFFSKIPDFVRCPSKSSTQVINLFNFSLFVVIQ